MVTASEDRGRRRGRPPRSDAGATRERILHNAREVFNEVGYEKTTFKEIAERADVTRPTVNHHFGSKGELFNAIFDATGTAVIGAGVVNAARQESLGDKITAFLEAAVRVDSADPSHARFIAGSLVDAFRNPELRDRALGQIDDVRSFVADALREAQRDGQVSAHADVSALSEMLIAVLWGMGLYAGFVGGHRELESVVTEFGRLLSTADW